MTRTDKTWLEEVSAARQSLQQKVAAEQERIRQRIAHEETPTFTEGQMVLVRRTPAEVQQAHSKLTDAFDHPARVIKTLPNGISFKIAYVKNGGYAIVNRRNLCYRIKAIGLGQIFHNKNLQFFWSESNSVR